jgi:2-polyprenyl-6-methoxyphenol hydroxylase-like FAD-dependent oxidoreductase
MQTALISGASVAGPALAYWLQQLGWRVTVVERAAQLRPGGQAVDIRGVALEVVSRMGLLEEVRNLRTRLKGMSVLDKEGKEIHRSEERTLSGGRFDSGDIEIFRDDLANLLHGLTRDGVTYQFDDSIDELEQRSDSVDVRFRSGRRGSYDLVMGADGLRSNVRRIVFGGDEQFLRSLGAQVAIFSVDNFLGLEDWQIAFRDETSGYLIFPTRDNQELRVFFGFEEKEDAERLAIPEQKTLVRGRCGGMGWKVPALLEAMHDASDFYLSAISQVHMPRWSQGHVALVGDAGYCPSPMSGQGTSLALVGAYVLAHEIKRAGDDYSAAFAAYEARMRPYVELNQALATESQQGEVSDATLTRAKNAIALDSAEF